MAKDTKNNTGVDNTGNGNSGNGNSGNGNSGNWNSGYGNSGYWNSGNGNSGDGNSGNGNSGDVNSGDRNSGDWNSGYVNSGDRNSGDWNSGYGNRTDRETGIFNTTQGKIRCFNKETDIAWDDIQHPYFSEFYLNKWIPESDMTDAEKKADPDFFVRGGYLKTFEWEEAWSNYWRDCDDEEKQRVLNLPNFDPAIFKEVTGIDVEVESKPETIVIGDKKYQVTDELKDALKNLKESQ